MMVLMNVLMITAVFMVGVQGQASWKKIDAVGDDFPRQRSSAIMAFDDGKEQLVLYGGRDENGDLLDDLWVFDVETSRWNELEQLGDIKPPPRFSFAGGLDSLGNSLIVFGGESINGLILNDIWKFDLDTRLWTDLSPPAGELAPTPRYGHSGGILTTGDNATTIMLMSHGFDKLDRFNDSMLFHLEQKRWIDITPQDPPFGRCLVAGNVFGTSPNTAVLGMMGGCGSGGYGPCPSNEMWILEVSELNDPFMAKAFWTEAPECMRGRNYGAMVGSPTFEGGSFFVFGGDGGPLVGKDEPGQINTVSISTLETSLNVLGSGNDAPGHDGGSAQAALAISSENVIWMQNGNSNDLFRLDLSSMNTTLAELEQQECVGTPIPALRVTHGVLMGLSWGFLLPIGVFIARFGRIRNPLWFKLHRGIQSVGLILAILGFVAAMLMVSTGKFLAVPHSLIGVVVTFIGIQQPLNAYFRPHKTNPVSSTRLWWEYWHKYSGRVAIVLGLINPFWGISYFVSTRSFGFVIYSLWVAIYLSAFVYLTARGLPFEANGPSWLAKWINETLHIQAWNDSFKPRGRVNDLQKQHQNEERQIKEEKNIQQT